MGIFSDSKINHGTSDLMEIEVGNGLRANIRMSIVQNVPSLLEKLNDELRGGGSAVHQFTDMSPKSISEFEEQFIMANGPDGKLYALIKGDIRKSLESDKTGGRLVFAAGQFALTIDWVAPES